MLSGSCPLGKKKKIDLGCLSFTSEKKLSQQTSPASRWPELGHMAMEPFTWKGDGNVIGVLETSGFSGHFIASLLTHLFYILKTLNIADITQLNYWWFKL